MDIKYFGHSSFFIKTKNSRVVTDPFDPKIGIKFPKTEADIVTVSHGHSDHNFLGQISGEPLILDWPGEFEKQGVRVTGFSSFHDKQKGAERGANTLYKIEADGVSIVHCGDLGVVPDDNFISQLGEVNILMVPVGGFYTIDANEAVELIKKVEPSMVIPMHYNAPYLNQETFGKLTTVDDFLKKIGAESAQRTSKLSVKEGDFGEEMQVVVMELEK
jgi:L-ascorbate metabolism protein UlaG (beta-lactamase superfamily)